LVFSILIFSFLRFLRPGAEAQELEIPGLKARVTDGFVIAN